MSGYFGFKTYGKIYRKGYEDDAIEDAFVSSLLAVIMASLKMNKQNFLR